MMQSQATTFRRSAAQCFVGIIALALVTFVCFRLKAGLATAAFIYLAVIVLLSLFGGYFASVVFTIPLLLPPSGPARWRQIPVSRQPQTHL
jgi:hypothetical protein